MHHLAARLALASFLTGALAAGADVTGIWAGQQQGRRGEPEDIAFRFQRDGQNLTGKLFGDEFDLPVADLSVAGDVVRFTITTTNYYSGTKTTFTYTGTIKGNEMELVRERVMTPEDKVANRPVFRQNLKLRRL